MFSFRYEPPVSRKTIASWQAQLNAIFPPSTRLSQFVVRWEPGDIWQPIQRFIIWHCEDTHNIAVPPMVEMGLKGPHPRAKGHYCASGSDERGRVWCMCPIKSNGWRSSANRGVDRETWLLHRDTGLWGRRWWTIQGSKGGHRFQWASDEIEARLSQMHGGPLQTPSPGDLPYAPFDQRVLDRIAPLDKVRFWSQCVDYAERHPDQLDAEEDAEATAFREALWKHLDWGIEEAWEAGGSALKQYLREDVGRLKPGTHTNDVDHDAIHEGFLSHF